MLCSNSYLYYYAGTTSLALDSMMPLEHLVPHSFLSVHKGPNAPYPYCARVVLYTIYFVLILRDRRKRKREKIKATNVSKQSNFRIWEANHIMPHSNFYLSIYLSSLLPSLFLQNFIFFLISPIFFPHSCIFFFSHYHHNYSYILIIRYSYELWVITNLQVHNSTL